MNASQISIQIVGRNGSLTKIRVINGASHRDSAPEIGRFFATDGDDLIVSCAAREIETIRQWADVIAIVPVAENHQNQHTGERRIALLSECIGINHGRAWIADGYTVDKHSLPPEWEGRSVCYVYE